LTTVPESGTPSPTVVGAALRGLLATQYERLRRRFFWHGVALTAAATGLAILLFFGLDHWLRLPLPIRLFHSAVIVGLVVAGTIRFVRYPLSRRFHDVDLATWVERSFPELHQRLVSTLQLNALPADDLRNQSREMIDRLVVETQTVASGLPFDRLFDDRRMRRVVAAAGGVAVILGTLAVLQPAVVRAFVLRHLGGSAEYPRETHLLVELPPAGPDLQRNDRDGTSELLLPAGADLHVTVLAEGVVPKDVFLEVTPRRDATTGVADARSIAMTPRPGGRFRYVFRRLSGSFEFHARGGDDDHGDRTVVVRTVHPPQVASITASITPPAYTGIANVEQTGGAIEALAGSTAVVTLTTTAAVTQATMKFLERGHGEPMQPVAIQDDSGAGTTYRCTFVIDSTDRYQIELLGGSGLRNPNPGTYPITALQDYAPVGRWLLPDDEALLLLPNALLCVRVDVHDDFGLRVADLVIDRNGQRAGERSLLPPPTAPDAAPLKNTLVTEFLEVKELLAGNAATGNDGLVLQLTIADNRAPAQNKTELPRRIVQIVDAPQLSAAIAKAFRSMREDIEQALDIQTDRKARLQDLAARGADAGTGVDALQILTSVEVGQSRVNTACERTHRALMRSFDVHLWNRLEPSPNAAQVVELYEQRSRTLTEPIALDPDFYRDLLERRTKGTLGGMETTLDPILAMIGLADGIVARSGPETARLLAEAQVARDAGERAPLLERAVAAQTTIEQSLQQLLSRLEEWNDYQDLVQETRALRDRQRDLQNRTEEARGNK